MSDDSNDERARRIGGNEALFREVNERIEQLNVRFAATGDQSVQIVCECGSMSCVEMLSVPVAKYEQVRSDATLFLILTGHEMIDVEEIVEVLGDFQVVRKREGPAAEIVEATDPRAEPDG